MANAAAGRCDPSSRVSAPRYPRRYGLKLEFTPAVADNLERMIESSHSARRTEVIRKAFRLFDMVLGHRDTGGKLVFQHEDGTQETVQIL